MSTQQTEPQRLTGNGLAVDYRPIEALKPYARNPRTHTKKQIRQIADSIRQFGFTNPLLTDSNDGVIAGHGRLAAAQQLGMTTVPTIRLDQLTEAQKRAYILADNKLAEQAGWDTALLAQELAYLDEIEIDFDITITGFETAEIDVLLNSEDDAAPDPSDTAPAPDRERPPISQPGDLWLFGKHRLLCADATQAAAFEQLMAGEQAQLVFIDPPYNVRIDGHVCGLGRIKHREFAMATGEMSPEQFTAFLHTSFQHLVEHAQPGSIHYVCMDWRHITEILTAAEGIYTELKNLCVWNKANAGMGSLYRSKHELVFVFKAGKAPHINNVELGQHGRYRTNVWDYPGVNSLGASQQDLALHPTVKPIALVADAIQDCSQRQGIVLDCFAGSGTTLIAAERTGRVGYAMEYDPAYVDVILQRLQDTTGLEAVHAESGLDFATLRETRQMQPETDPKDTINNTIEDTNHDDEKA